MKLTNSACLVALLVCPLAATAVYGADDYYDMHYNNTPDASGTVQSSGYKETPTGEWRVVFISRAETYDESVKVVESSNNEAILGEGLTVGTFEGGNARSYQTSRANTNSLVLKNGLVLEEGGVGTFIVGASAQGKNAEACYNTVTVEKNFKEDFYSLVAGLACYDASDSQYIISSNNNIVIIKEGFEGVIQELTVGEARSGGTSGSTATASNNELYITTPAKAEIEWLKIAKVDTQSGSDGEIEEPDSFANNNKGELVLSENTQLKYPMLAEVVAFTGNAEANGNRLQVTGGKIGDGARYDNRVVQVLGYTVKANSNTVVLTDVAVDCDNFFGVYASASWDVAEHEAEANGNALILKGGTYKGNIKVAYATVQDAQSGAVEASNNRLELRNGPSGAPDLANASINVASTGPFRSNSNDVTVKSTGNSLNFYDVKGMTVRAIYGFQILNYEYSEMHADDVILTTSSSVDIDNSDVRVRVINLYGKGNSEFKQGDKVVLLKSKGALSAQDFTQDVKIGATTGVSLAYDDVVVQTDGSELILTRPKSDDDSGKDDDGGKTDNNTDNSGSRDNGGTHVQPGTKAIAEGAAAGLALVNESSNAAIELLREFSLTAGSITPFVHVQASSTRHETGSSINVSAVSLLAGLGTGIDTGAGNLSLGAFFEYGKGSYTTHNSFSNYSDVDGDGNSWYMGGGILAKMDFVHTGPGHFYLEGSAHMGTLHNEFDSNDLFDASGRVAKFDMDSPYYSLHGGLGYVWNMAEGHDLDIYGKYIWTRVQGTDDTLTTKDKFDYDDMDSNRVRFGVRYTYKGSERFKPYVGAAFEHEFSGTCESTAYGHPVAAPSFEGSSGMGELGLMMKPTEDLPLSINLGVQGYVGQKQGISGSCNFVYEF